MSQFSKLSKPKQQDGNQSPATALIVGNPKTSNLPNRYEDQKADPLIWFLNIVSTFFPPYYRAHSSSEKRGYCCTMTSNYPQSTYL